MAKKLHVLIGHKFPLSDKPRTNGSNLRKLLEKILDDGSICLADKKDYKIVPKRRKGIPRLLACLSDPYIVTTGDIYNLQVWNRFPNTHNSLIRYNNGKADITCKDIRFIFVKIDENTHTISSIIIATPDYIVSKFGPFGIPTIKYQMIISNSKRNEIINDIESCFFREDTHTMSRITTSGYITPYDNISTPPSPGRILSLECIKERVLGSLVGLRLYAADTKTRGQSLERIVASLLGYDAYDSLVGGYPDIPNQLLEVKVQDASTVDLGKYSPANPTVVNEELDITTEDIRYLIALTDSEGVIVGLILSPGAYLCNAFSFVSDTNFKCQRSIPMSFFDKYSGKSVFNP